jgi:hypothetical protein
MRLKWPSTSRLIVSLPAAILFVCGCSALPHQPQTTPLENAYFRSLNAAYHCSVSREIDPRQKDEKMTAHDESWYFIKLDSLSCNFLNDTAMLRTIGKRIANDLQNKVLTSGFDHPYDVITVSFECHPEKDASRTVDFSFPEYKKP